MKLALLIAAICFSGEPAYQPFWGTTEFYFEPNEIWLSCQYRDGGGADCRIVNPKAVTIYLADGGVCR